MTNQKEHEQRYQTFLYIIIKSGFIIEKEKEKKKKRKNKIQKKRFKWQ
jgi:hypothetical protein